MAIVEQNSQHLLLVCCCSSPTLHYAMNARDREQNILNACKLIVAGSINVAETDEQANVVNVAAMLCGSADAAASARLHKTAARYFEDHPDARFSTQEVLQRGWIISLPRFRSMLEQQVCNQ